MVGGNYSVIFKRQKRLSSLEAFKEHFKKQFFTILCVFILLINEFSNASIKSHCMKSVQVRSFFWYVFSCIQAEYGDLLYKYPHLVRIKENINQKNLRIWTLFTQWVITLLLLSQLNLCIWATLPLHKKWSFPWIISSFFALRCLLLCS